MFSKARVGEAKHYQVPSECRAHAKRKTEERLAVLSAITARAYESEGGARLLVHDISLLRTHAVARMAFSCASMAYDLPLTNVMTRVRTCEEGMAYHDF